MTSSENLSSYAASGVEYSLLDPFKKIAQRYATTTTTNLTRFRASGLDQSRGEPAFVWEENGVLRAKTMEGLGTKNLVADKMRVADRTGRETGRTYYDVIGHDTVATIVNDLICVGAKPQVITAFLAVGSSDWFKNEQRVENLVKGWTRACNMVGVCWAGGETQALKDVIHPKAVVLAGDAIGIIDPKDRLTLEEKLAPGDAILLIESNGLHTNGYSLPRKLAREDRTLYRRPLSDGRMFGEALLEPSLLYLDVINDLFYKGIDIHYMSHITGHGFRKIMRARKELTYVIDQIPDSQEVFLMLQELARVDDEEMYGNYNMGAGFAVFVSQEQAQEAAKVVDLYHKLKVWVAGYIEEGPRRVVINPKGIVFEGESLDIRST